MRVERSDSVGGEELTVSDAAGRVVMVLHVAPEYVEQARAFALSVRPVSAPPATASSPFPATRPALTLVRDGLTGTDR